MTLDEFNNTKKQILDHITITEKNISEKLLQWPKIYSKYLSIYTNQSLSLNKLKVDLDDKYGKLYMEFKTNSRYDLKVAEIEYNIASNNEYTSLKKEYLEQESYTKFLESFLGMVKNMNYNMHDYVQLSIFLSGGR